MKEKMYSDLDFTKYEFLPFIVETSGGMSKAAHGFCKELRRRREALNWNCDKVDVKGFTAADPLLVAISVELQTSNSRMILERAPRSGNLIETDTVKCKQSIAIKRRKATESLRLEKQLMPTRISNFRTEKNYLQKGSHLTKAAHRAVEEPQTSKLHANLLQDFQGFQNLPSTSGVRRPKQIKAEWLIPPVPPKPPDRTRQDEAVGRGKRELQCVVDERKWAPETCICKFTTASVTQAKEISILTVEPMAWEPPEAQEGQQSPAGSG